MSQLRPCLQSDKKVYLAECEKKFGFREKFKEEKAITFEQFGTIVGNWDNILHACFLAALRSGNYVRIRNALLILNKLIRVRIPSSPVGTVSNSSPLLPSLLAPFFNHVAPSPRVRPTYPLHISHSRCPTCLSAEVFEAQLQINEHHSPVWNSKHRSIPLPFFIPTRANLTPQSKLISSPLNKSCHYLPCRITNEFCPQCWCPFGVSKGYASSANACVP